MNDRLAGLDALRGIAAVSVLLFHLVSNAIGEGPSNAYLAVDFFFLLSGYLMARTYEDRLSTELGPWAFFCLRYARLWPVIAISMLIGLPAFVSVHGLSWASLGAVLLNIILLPSFYGGQAFPLNFPAWSIFFELAANLFHGLIIWRVRTRLLLFAVCLLLAIFIMHGLDHSPLKVGMDSATFLVGFRRVLLTYLLGVWMYRTFGDVAPFSVPPWITLAIMPAMFAGTWLLGFNPGGLDLVFVVALCPALLVGGLSLEPNALLRWLGRISFPLYAVHAPIMTLLIVYDLPIVLMVPLSLACAAAIEPVGRVLRSGLTKSSPGMPLGISSTGSAAEAVEPGD